MLMHGHLDCPNTLSWLSRILKIILRSKIPKLLEDAYKDREASQDNVLSQVRCDPRVTTFQSSLLSVFDWGTAVDGGIGKGEYLFGDFDHVVPPCSTQRRPP